MIEPTEAGPGEITLELDTVRLRALSWEPAEPAGAPLAVLLHGFPDSAHSWRFLGPALAARGWRVAAPFTRGYAPSAAAADGSGHVEALVDDAVGVHRLLGGDGRAALIGHDWGAITANTLAAHPENPYGKVVSMAVPPLAALRDPAGLRVLPRQLRNSWYVIFNQLPVVPERMLEPLVRRLWRDWSPGYPAEEDVAAALRALHAPASRRAALGYYRSLARPLPRVPARYRRWSGALMEMPRMPILYLHGEADGCLDPRLAALAAPTLPPGSRAVVVAGAGHFLQVEQPERVFEAIADHLG